jgi:hypothetical protein
MLSRVKTYKTNKMSARKKYFIPIFIFLISSILFIWYLFSIQRPDTKIFFKETFDQELPNKWETADLKLKKSNDDGIAVLRRDKYFAPILGTDYSLEDSPQKSFTWKFSVRINDFTNETVMLGMIEFPNNDFAVITNKEGQIGITKNLFEEAIYSPKISKKLTLNKWYDITIHFNKEKNIVHVYVDGNKLLETEFNENSYPINSIWLGSVWVGGKEELGVPLGIEFDDLTIANDSQIPVPNFFEFIRNKVIDLFNIF